MNRPRTNKLLIIAAACVIAAVTLSSCHQMIPLEPDYKEFAPTLAPPLSERLPEVGTSVGSLAPEFKLTDLKGQPVELSDYRGKFVMLNFWTYCDACKEELPYIQTVANEPQVVSGGVVILAVNVTQDEEQVEQFVNYNDFTLNFLLDRWGTVASDYYIHQIPTTYFIDKNGIIQDVHVGKFSGPDVIRQKLSELINR